MVHATILQSCNCMCFTNKPAVILLNIIFRLFVVSAFTCSSSNTIILQPDLSSESDRKISKLMVIDHFGNMLAVIMLWSSNAEDPCC